MLTASLLKIFYWPGARYDTSLLIQALIMVAVQLVLLKVALDNRPPRRNGDQKPFQGLDPSKRSSSSGSDNSNGAEWYRPGRFWRWRVQRPYWETVGGFTLFLLVMHTIVRPQPGATDPYTLFIGYVGLATEAILPIPQMMANASARSCKGFRVSVLGNWLLGDVMKMGFFFLAEEGKVPTAFKLCGSFQACCDVGLGVQWWMYGDGEEEEGYGRGRDKEKGDRNGHPL